MHTRNRVIVRHHHHHHTRVVQTPVAVPAPAPVVVRERVGPSAGDVILGCLFLVGVGALVSAVLDSDTSSLPRSGS